METGALNEHGHSSLDVDVVGDVSYGGQVAWHGASRCEARSDLAHLFHSRCLECRNLRVVLPLILLPA